MKKAVFYGNGKAGLVDVPTPRPLENWALVKIHAAPLCTEYKGFRRPKGAQYLGHEAAGEVVEVAQPGRVKVGDRVAVMPQYPCGKCSLCRAGDYIHCQNNYNYEEFVGSKEGSATMAQYMLKPDWLLEPIPQTVSYVQGSLACCALGPSFGALDTMGLTAFETVLITGLGPVGLGAVVNAAYRGARIIAVEGNQYRAELAKRLGAETVLDPAAQDLPEKIKELTAGKGPHQGLDCSGVVAAQRLLIETIRRKGSVGFVGEGYDQLPLTVSPDLIRKGLTIFGGWHYNQKLFPQILQVIENSPVVDQMVTHILPMSEIQAAMELSESQRCGKIVLLPWE